MTLKKLVLITAGALLLSGTAMARNINVPGDYSKIADALGNADAGPNDKDMTGMTKANTLVFKDWSGVGHAEGNNSAW